MDFVFESGSEELDDLAIVSLEAKPSHGEASFQKTNVQRRSKPLMLQSTTHREQAQEGADQKLHPLHLHSEQLHLYRSFSEKRLSRPKKRLWPLRDPQEAHLLKHFVDHIASFVSLANDQC